MTIEDLNKKILDFRDQRDWKQFHALKDLLIGLGIEVSELSELFLWKSQSEQLAVDVEKIRDEVADVYIFLAYICNHFDIDMSEAIINKIEKNNLKYPVEKSKGVNKKYSEL